MTETIDSKLTSLREVIADFCWRHRVRKLSLYGSALTDNFAEGSDIDFLVQFHPDSIPGLLYLVAMERELSQLLDGRKIDLRTPEDLSPYFRDQVIDKAVCHYEDA